MKKQIFSAVASLAVVAAMSVSAFAVDAGSTNGSASGKVGDDGKFTSAVATVEGLPAGTEVEVEVEPVAAAAAQEVLDKVAKDTTATVKVTAVNTVVDVDAGEVQPDGSVKVTVASDGVSNGVIYIGEDGKVESLPTETTDTTLTFTTTHFSTFYLVTLATTGDTDNGNGDDKNQPTGVVLAVVPAIAAAAAIVVAKKRK